MGTLTLTKERVAGLLTQYSGRENSSKEDQKEAGELLALVLTDKIPAAYLQTAVGLGATDILIGFLRRLASQQGQSITHPHCPRSCCQHEQPHPHQLPCP